MSKKTLVKHLQWVFGEASEALLKRVRIIAVEGQIFIVAIRRDDTALVAALKDYAASNSWEQHASYLEASDGGFNHNSFVIRLPAVS